MKVCDGRGGASICVRPGIRGCSARAMLILVLAYTLCAIPVFAGEVVSSPGTSIRSGCEFDYPPFCIVDEGGHADGFSVELLRAALGAMDRDVTFQVGPWAEVKGLLERGEVDTLPLVARTPERESTFDFTFPYLTLHGAIVVREGTSDIHDLNELKGRNVAVMEGDIAEEFVRRFERELTLDIHMTPTFENALRELSDGRHDAVVIQGLLALRLIQQAGITNLRIAGRPLEGFRQDICFGVKEGDRETLSLLNEGLALVIADGTFSDLQTKWFATLELPSDDRIVIGGDHNYPPYEFLDENGRPAGYNVELTRSIARQTGLDVEIRFGLWADIRQGLASGEIDAVHGMFYSPERDKQYDFSPLHAVIHHVAVVRKGEGAPPINVGGLTGKRIVVMQGDIMHDWVVEKGLDAQVAVVATQEDALMELAAGQHDCALVAQLPAVNWIKKHGWENLAVADSSLLAPEYCYAVPPNQKLLLSKLAEGLKILHDSGEYQRIYAKWMGVYESTPVSPAIIFRYIAIAVGSLFLLLFISLIWARTLHKQVKLLTAKLQDGEKHIGGLSQAPAAIGNAKRAGKTMSARGRLVFMVLIMVGACVTVMVVMTVMLYRFELEERREMLEVSAQSQARLIESVARYDAKMARIMMEGDLGKDAPAATLSQITDAHENYQGFHETGEFTLARRDGNYIVFVLRHRHDAVRHPAPVAFDSDLAEPMRRALKGESGTVIGLDYRGKRVLAAHEPVAELNMGIVVKIDMAEVRAPFIHSVLAAAAVAILVVLAGTALLFRVGNPIIERLEAQTRELKSEVVQRRESEEKIATSLREKEVLLREVHHRVKNNMQSITSLLNMQSRRIDNPQALHAFSEARNWIQAMALVHETLHRSEDLSRILLREYVEKLVNGLAHSVGAGGISPTVTVVSEDMELNIDQAIPVGLIINELVSNAIEHAFPEGRQGEVRVVTGQRGESKIELVISDNGIGLPDGIGFEHGDTLGLQLVGSLVRDQLGGRIEIVRNGGTTFRITFKPKTIRERT